MVFLGKEGFLFEAMFFQQRLLQEKLLQEPSIPSYGKPKNILVEAPP